MSRWWVASGPPEYWKVAFEMGRIWGVIDKKYSQWKKLSSGDYILFYATKPVSGVIGYGVVRTKFRQDKPLWPREVEEGRVIWPYRFEFDVEYCLPQSEWEKRKVTSKYIAYAAIGGFQQIKEEEARKIISELVPTERVTIKPVEQPSLHDQVKTMLLEVGKLQGFIAESEYPMDVGRLDVVWRRVERGVPTYAFEVHVGGDVYHAVSKLKHAHDLWNSNIFLITTGENIEKAHEILSGVFHEIRGKIRIIKVEEINELLKRKKAYKDLEAQLGIL
jgi:predicted RNA-binding protein